MTYVPGSLQITAGANTGAKTDAAADDQGDYNGGTNTVTFRLGTGASGTMGGSITYVHGMRVLNLVDEPTRRAIVPATHPEKEDAAR